MEILLEHEERIWTRGTPHSWEAVDPVYSSYTPDITPLILAAHKVMDNEKAVFSGCVASLLVTLFLTH